MKNTTVAADTTPVDYWKKLIALLCFGWLTIWVYRTMLTPIYAEIQQTIGQQSETGMGLISSCYFFGYTFTQIPGGILMDRLGKKRVLIPGFFLFLAGILIVGSARSIGMLYLGSALAGIGTGTYYAGAFSLSAQEIPRQRRFVGTAVINNGCAVGMIVGLLSATFLVKPGHLSWHGLVYGAAVLSALMIPAMALVLKNDQPAAQWREVDVPARSLRSMFRPPLLTSYFLYFSTCYGYYMIVTWLPSFLEQEKGITGSAMGLSAAVVAVASIPGALFFGGLVDRFGQRKILLLTALQILAAVMLVLTAKTSSIPFLLVCLALYGITGKQAIDPLIVPYVTGLNNRHNLSTALGIFNFFGMSSSILAPFLTGMISDQLGSKVLGFYLAAALLIISASIFYLQSWKERDTNGLS